VDIENEEGAARMSLRDKTSPWGECSQSENDMGENQADGPVYGILGQLPEGGNGMMTDKKPNYWTYGSEDWNGKPKRSESSLAAPA